MLSVNFVEIGSDFDTLDLVKYIPTSQILVVVKFIITTFLVQRSPKGIFATKTQRFFKSTIFSLYLSTCEKVLKTDFSNTIFGSIPNAVGYHQSQFYRLPEEQPSCNMGAGWYSGSLSVCKWGCGIRQLVVGMLARGHGDVRSQESPLHQ